MTSHPIAADRREWIEARLRLLQREKELTKLHDEISAERRALPWVPVTQDYRLEGPEGSVSLSDLFGRHSQLLVYHFMFNPSWDEGCPSCSFWADSFDRAPVHLAHRDVAFAAVSRAPHGKLAAYQERMGWTFPWYSSAESTFNYDYNVSFTPEDLQPGEGTYNFGVRLLPMEDQQGLSAFVKEGGVIYHTYSTYARGIDPFNAAYQLLDLAPRGRDEGGLPWTMAWLRRHDQYDDAV